MKQEYAPMSRQKRTGPRPTPRPTHDVTQEPKQPILRSVDSAEFKRDLAVRAGTRAGLGMLAAAVTLVGGFKLLDAGEQWAREENEKRVTAVADATPNKNDICVVIGENAIPRVVGDRFGDGTNAIIKISDGFSVVTQIHPGDGVGICRPTDGEELNDNHVVAPVNIPADQIVSMDQFEKAGGVSEDVTLGR